MFSYNLIQVKMFCITLEIIFYNTLMNEGVLGLRKREIGKSHELLGQICVEISVDGALLRLSPPDASDGG